VGDVISGVGFRPGAHLGGLFGCHDKPLCIADTQH